MLLESNTPCSVWHSPVAGAAACAWPPCGGASCVRELAELPATVLPTAGVVLASWPVATLLAGVPLTTMLASGGVAPVVLLPLDEL